MRQLTQKLKDGQLRVLEVPSPVLGAGQILVRNHYSVISAGTESSTVSAARKGLIGKARERPQQVKQVFDTLSSQGPVQTWRAVMKKLEAHSPLGYSSAGEVLAVAPDVTDFVPGDRVACAGVGYANHAEFVAVPVKLAVKLAPEADLRKAAYNTVAAIALQGIRQAELKLGESCLVIGLGLIGHLTALMLRAGGIKVLGSDVLPEMVQQAKRHCVEDAWLADDGALLDKVLEATDGLGVDAVIITAGTSSDGPINLAGRVARQKGRVVVVGAVPTGFEREHYYRKELELRMSCSYGPGRYDPNYEEHGLDYPVGYVRWTENRNMAAFQQMAHSGRLNMDYLTTHEFALDEAPQAYDLILGRAEPYLGMVIRYQAPEEPSRGRIPVVPAGPRGAVNVSFVGAGSYAQSFLLPNVKGTGVRLRGVLTASGTSSRSVADRYGFEFCTANEADIFANDDVDTVFVATRHNTHAEYVTKAIDAGKNVFVEKPLCLSYAELTGIEKALAAAGDAGRAPRLMVGFNRRFSPLSRALVDGLGAGPRALLYRVNAGAIPPTSWIQDPAIGGGRILGEVCHFVDYLTFLAGALPTQVTAAAIPDPHGVQDTLTVQLVFANGSVGSINYFSNGHKGLAKEYVEVYAGGTTAVLKDYRELELFGGSAGKRKLLVQDKGQADMVARFLDSVKRGSEAPIPAAELLAVTRATLAIVESLRTARPVAL